MGRVVVVGLRVVIGGRMVGRVVVAGRAGGLVVGRAAVVAGRVGARVAVTGRVVVRGGTVAAGGRWVVRVGVVVAVIVDSVVGSKAVVVVSSMVAYAVVSSSLTVVVGYSGPGSGCGRNSGISTSDSKITATKMPMNMAVRFSLRSFRWVSPPFRKPPKCAVRLPRSPAQ